MSSSHATLSAISSSLEEITTRITAEADRYAGTERDDVANDLYEIERNLRAASRKIERLMERL